MTNTTDNNATFVTGSGKVTPSGLAQVSSDCDLWGNMPPVFNIYTYRVNQCQPVADASAVDAAAGACAAAPGNSEW